MAGNKKPKKRYNPNRNRNNPQAHVSYQSAAKVFFPVVNALQSLRDEVTLVNEVPMALDWEGDWVPMAPLLVSWCEWFERVGLDCSAMHALSDKLKSGADIFERDVVAAEAVLQAQLEKFVSMRVGEVKSKVLTYQIFNEMRRLGVGEGDVQGS